MKHLHLSRFWLIAIAVLTFLTFNSCMTKTNKKTMRIALSKATDNYINYVHRVDSTI